MFSNINVVIDPESVDPVIVYKSLKSSSVKLVPSMLE